MPSLVFQFSEIEVWKEVSFDFPELFKYCEIAAIDENYKNLDLSEKSYFGVYSQCDKDVDLEQWSQIWNRRIVSHSQPAYRCEASGQRGRGTLPFFLPRHSCMRERLVTFPFVLLAFLLQCMRYQLFQVLDFRPSFIESKLQENRPIIDKFLDLPIEALFVNF